MRAFAELFSGRTRGARSGLPLFGITEGRKGYSLTELLVVFAIILIFSFAFYPAVGGLMSSRNGTPQAARSEAKKISRWIERILQKACLDHRAFNVKYLGGFREEIMVLWFNPSEYEIYRTEGRCKVYFKSTSTQDRCYTPAWHTMTPAFTLSLHVPDQSRQKVAEIAVSGYCRVSLTALFP